MALLGLQYNGSRRYFEKFPNKVACAWNAGGGSRRVFMEAARDAGAARLYFEFGVFPGTITIDPRGVNYSSALPHRIGPYLDWLASHPVATDLRCFGESIRQRPASGGTKPLSPNMLPLDAPFLFVPLQYPGDSQLRLFGGAFRAVEAFVDGLLEASSALPPGWHLRLKEHPSAPHSIADRILHLAKGLPICLDNQTDTFEQVRASRGVITVNSSVGVEAMLFDKPVVACGDCFWAIDGVALHARDVAALAKLLAQASKLSFDAQARQAFLSFLVEEYYPRLPDQDMTDKDAEAEVAKVLRRLSPMVDDPIWSQGQAG